MATDTRMGALLTCPVYIVVPFVKCVMIPHEINLNLNVLIFEESHARELLVCGLLLFL